MFRVAQSNFVEKVIHLLNAKAVNIKINYVIHSFIHSK